MGPPFLGINKINEQLSAPFFAFHPLSLAESRKPLLSLARVTWRKMRQEGRCGMHFPPFLLAKERGKLLCADPISPSSKNARGKWQSQPGRERVPCRGNLEMQNTYSTGNNPQGQIESFSRKTIPVVGTRCHENSKDWQDMRKTANER